MGREILTSLPQGYKVQGWSNEKDGNYNKDILGRRDYSKQLKVTYGGKTFDISPVNGKYSVNGQEFTLKGYGGGVSAPVDYNVMFDKIPAAVTTGEAYDYTNDLTDLEAATQGAGEFNDNLTKQATALKWSLTNDPTVKNNKVLKEKIIQILDKYNSYLGGASVMKHKVGGIIKAQKGIDFKAYQSKLNSAAKLTEKTAEGPRDTSGTWKGQTGLENALDVASTAGAVASFIPGVGAIGAGVTTGADLAKDLQDGKIDDWGTHALNLGFVGLSAIGLGGIKTLLKFGKTADKGFDIAKVLTKSEKLGKVLTSSEKTALQEIAKLSETQGAKTTQELLEKVAKLDAPKKVLADKVIKEGVEALEVVKNASTPVLGSNSLGIAKQVIGKGLVNTPELLTKLASNKFVRKGLRVAGMTPGLMAVPRVASTIYNDGIEYTRPEDFKTMAIAGSIGKTWYQDFKGMRAIERQTTVGTKTNGETTFKLGDKEFSVNKTIDRPKDSKILGLNKDKLPFKNKEKIAIKNEEIDNKLKDELIATLKAEGKITEEEVKTLKDLKLSDVNAIHEVKDDLRVLGKGPRNTTGDRTIDTRDYKLAKKYISKYQPKRIATTEINEKVEAPVVSDKPIPPKALPSPKVKPTRSPEEVAKRAAKMKEIRDLQEKMGSKVKNKDLGTKVNKLKKVQPKTKENKMIQEAYAKTQGEFNQYRDEIRKILSKKQGGIVKHQTSNGEGIVRNTIPGNYTKVPKNLNSYIPYGELTDFQKTPEWETFRKGISEQQFLEYLPDLNKQIAATKSAVQFTPKDYSKFTRLVTDQYSGPVQNFVMNKYQATLPEKTVQEPTPTTPVTPVTPAITPANPIVKTPISPDNKTGIAYKPTPKPIN